MRKCVNGAGEVTYQNWFKKSGHYIYEGGNELMHRAYSNGVVTEVKYATEFTYTNDDTPGEQEWEIVETYVADENSRITGTTDSLGRNTAYHIAGSGVATSHTFPDLTSSLSTYNNFKKPLTQTDRLGRITNYTYDSSGNLLTQTVAVDAGDAEATFIWTYNSLGQVLTATDANGNVTNYEYHPTTNQLVKIISPADVFGETRPEVLYTYDSNGRLETSTDPLGRTTTFAYDVRNRTSNITYNDTSTETFTYGSGIEGNLLVQYTDRNENTRDFAYDAAGRLSIATEGFGSNAAVQRVCTYLTGTTHQDSCVVRGEKTLNVFDYRNRIIETWAYTNGLKGPNKRKTFYDDHQRVYKSEDTFGMQRLVFYDVNDYVVRSMQGTSPDAFGVGLDHENFARNMTGNADYLITEYEYDAEYQVLATIDPNGVRHTNEYDAQGRLVARVEAENDALLAARTEYVYDDQGNIIEIRMPRHFDVDETGDFKTTKTYTKRNLLASTTVAANTTDAATESLTYYLDGRINERTDAKNNIWKTIWHICCGRFQASRDPSGAGTISNVDYYGNVTHTATVEDLDVQTDYHNPTGVVNEVTTTYDALHRPLSQTVWLTDPGTVDSNNPPPAPSSSDGLTTYYQYDDDLYDGSGIVLTQIISLGGHGPDTDYSAVRITNPENEKSTIVRDGIGRVIMTLDGEGNESRALFDFTSNFYDGVEQHASDGLGNIIKTRVDGAGRVLQSIDAEGRATLFTYDNNGNLLSSRDANNNGIDYVYDTRNRQISSLDTQGDGSSAAYDFHNNLTTATDGLSNNIVNVYDARDRKITSTDRENAVTSFTYDDNNNLLELEDGEGSITEYLYEDRNLLESEQYPLGNGGTAFKAYSYDGAGRLGQRLVNTVESPLVLETTDYLYDQANRLLERQYPEETAHDDVFTYDDASRLLTATSNRYGNIVTKTYDDASRVMSESLNINSTLYAISYDYDNASRLTNITYPNGKVVIRDYTNRHQLDDVSYDSTVLATFTYDDGMRQDARNYGNSINTVLSHYDDNLIQSIIATKSPTTLLNLSYTYDANKRKRTEVDAQRALASQAFDFDDEDRLTSWSTDSTATNQSWTLSLVGDWDATVRTGANPVTETRTHTDAHETTAVNSNALTYDMKGNIFTNAQKAQSYLWDAENRMESASNSVDAIYRYDALGRRVEKAVTVSFVTTTTTYVSGGSQVFTEYENAVEKQSYVYGSYVDEPIALVKANGDTYYYHQGRNYSVEAITDSNGDLVETYDYDAYGTPTIRDAQGAVLTASVVGNPYMFTGRRLDAETGLYYFRARYFDSELGRFISRDQLGYVDGYGLYAGYFIPNGLDPSGNSERGKKRREFNDRIGRPKVKKPVVPQDNCASIAKAFTAQVHRIQKAIKSGGSSCPDNSSEIKQLRNTMNNLNRNFNELDCPNKMDVAAKETFANELAHTGLDLGGMLPLIGAFFDGWNAERYYAEGNILEGNMATAALAPGLGQLVTMGKYIGKFKKLFGGGDEMGGTVYKRTDPKTGDEYVGQAKNDSRFAKRQKEHDKKLGQDHEYDILGKAPAGKKLDVLEEDMIRNHGGLEKQGGTLKNKRHQMSEKNYRKHGGTIVDPNL
ncbi:MAG: RHS repeat protein [Planctomycetes bacterium]|nr:RHS repeat protein [Planctomycetota bacterium]